MTDKELEAWADELALQVEVFQGYHHPVPGLIETARAREQFIRSQITGGQK